MQLSLPEDGPARSSRSGFSSTIEEGEFQDLFWVIVLLHVGVVVAFAMRMPRVFFEP
jgi:cbb3-type cytochrome oxidase subunit 1